MCPRSRSAHQHIRKNFQLMARLIARHGAHGMEHQFRAAQTICEALTRAGAEFRKTQFIKCGAALLATNGNQNGRAFRVELMGKLFKQCAEIL